MTRPPRPPIDPAPPAPGGDARDKGAGTRVSNNLLALGSAAVLSIYGAGFQRTRAAADKFANEADAHARPTQQLLDAGGRGRSGGAPTGDLRATDALAPNGAGRATTTADAVSNATARSAGNATAAPAPGANAAAQPSGGNSSSSVASAVAAPIKGTDSASAHQPTNVATAAPVTAPVASSAPAPAPTSAPAPAAEPVKAAPTAPEGEKSRALWHDGSYTGWGTSRHGDIEATVVIAEGRIVSAQISRCLTRYSCSWIAHLQQQVVVRQSADVDFVSGATQSTNAFYYAVVEALRKAQ
jgi:uncharacterized protein with FMN-binding domain